MPHWLIIEKATNTHVSESSTPVANLPPELQAVDVVTAPDWARKRWNPATRALVDLPPQPAPLDLSAEFSSIKTSLNRKPDRKATAQIDAVLAKADATWVLADVAAVLRWVVTAIQGP